MTKLREGMEGYSANGTVFYSPKRRKFIQVREPYFNLNTLGNRQYPHTGHWIGCLSDAKDNRPIARQVSVSELRKCLNIEEVGLKNIKGLCFAQGTWWAPKMDK